MVDLERRRHERSWRLAASLLGGLALLVAGVAVDLVELSRPWGYVLGLAVIAGVLVGGTMWLVPSHRTSK